MSNKILWQKKIALQISEKKLAMQRYELRLAEIEEEVSLVTNALKDLEGVIVSLEQSLKEGETNG